MRGASCCTPPATAPRDAERRGTAASLVGVAGFASRRAAASREPVVASGLVALSGGRFTMGSDAPEAVPGDGEGPARTVGVGPFSIGAATVTNREFAAFVRASGHVSDAERAGVSFVFRLQLPEAMRRALPPAVAGLPWWCAVEGACWQRPEGPGSHVYGRPDHPVVHVSWHDASAYCAWAGARLPSEAEWEFAARGGLEGASFPWGEGLERDGVPRCNVWRGSFPDAPADGWRPAPVAARSGEANGYGLFNVCGNVWEWCRDAFSPGYHRETAAIDPLLGRDTGLRSLRGGSFLCHDSYCNRYRLSARSSNTPDSSASNIGFRVAA